MRIKLFFSAILLANFFFVACSGSAVNKKDTTTTNVRSNATYACPMHPDVTGKAGDKCSKCGMALEPVPGESTEPVYSCPMHPEITGKAGDKCSKCGMALEKSAGPAEGDSDHKQ